MPCFDTNNTHMSAIELLPVAYYSLFVAVNQMFIKSF